MDTKCKYCNWYDGGSNICSECSAVLEMIKDNPEAVEKILKEHYTNKEKMNDVTTTG